MKEKNSLFRLKYKCDLRSLKYDILRKLIQDRGILLKTYSKEEILKISYELEGRTLIELKVIHTKYLGYAPEER
jgi:hypothetical protein